MRKVYTILIVALLLGLGINAHAAKVDQVSLEYQNGFTVAKIKVDGQVRFTHQTEVAKDGKPFRVIVDVLSATHQLPSKKFTDLPSCPITRIRSSQYAVTPEAIVRVVFDMDTDRVYRIDTENGYVVLHFSDNNTKPFAAWNSTTTRPADKPVVTEQIAAKPDPAKPLASKSVKDVNESINKDRLASLESASKPAPKKAAKTVAKPTVKKPTAKPSYYGPEITVVDNNPASDSPQPITEPKKVVASKPKAQPKAEAKPKVVASKPKAQPKAEAKPKVVASKPKAQPKAEAKPKVVASKPKAQPKTEAKPKVVASKPKAQPKAEAKPKVVASKPKAQPKAEAKPKVVASKPKAQPKAASNKPATVAVKPAKKETKTARFRRSAKDSKIKGTLVAEFPKRLVIKYSGKRHRDPFETLINESKTYNDPVERKIPNVEGLKLVGIIESGSNDNRALFEDTEGYGYILKTGDKVRKGYVLRVDKTKVYFQIFEYGWSRTVALNLEN